jgi:hypothetical protein
MNGKMPPNTPNFMLGEAETWCGQRKNKQRIFEDSSTHCVVTVATKS